MVELSTLFGLSQTLAIIVGVAIAVMELRNMRQTRETELETRQIQLFMQIIEQTRTREYFKHLIEVHYNQDFSDYEEWREKYGPSTNPEAYATFGYIIHLFQNIGFLVQRKILDIEDLSKQIRPRAFIVTWEKVEPWVKVHRERYNPTAYDSFEYLVNEMRTLLERRMVQARMHTD